MTTATADKPSGTKGRKITIAMPDGSETTHNRVTSTHVTIVRAGDDAYWHTTLVGKWVVYMDHRSEAAAKKTAKDLLKYPDRFTEVMVLEVIDI